MKNLIQLKLNMDFKGYKKGSIICVKTNSDEKPFNVFWRNRLSDGCVEEFKNIPETAQKDKFKKSSKKEDVKHDYI